jgi:hypothetical protein
MKMLSIFCVVLCVCGLGCRHPLTDRQSALSTADNSQLPESDAIAIKRVIIEEILGRRGPARVFAVSDELLKRPEIAAIKRDPSVRIISRNSLRRSSERGWVDSTGETAIVISFGSIHGTLETAVLEVSLNVGEMFQASEYELRRSANGWFITTKKQLIAS